MFFFLTPLPPLTPSDPLIPGTPSRVLFSVFLFLFVFGLVQVLKSFSKLCPSSSLVTRSGETLEIDSTELVMGDVVTLKSVLGWVGLGWVGLGWVGLGWVGLGVGQGWVGLGWVGLGWVG